MNSTVQAIVIFLPILLFSIAIHEMMHAFASDWLGDPTARLMGRVTLNPLSHIDPFLTIALPSILILLGSTPFAIAKPVQVDFRRVRYQEFGGAIIGMVGPVTNLALASAAALIFRSTHPEVGTIVYNFFRYTIWLNVTLFVVNSIPWPPLDGSRLLYAFAPRPLQEFMESIERSGMTFFILFLFLLYTFFNAPIADIIASLVHFIAPGLIL